MSLLFLARFECICLLFAFVFIFRIDIADIIAVVALAIFVVDIFTFLNTCILVAVK